MKKKDLINLRNKTEKELRKLVEKNGAELASVTTLIKTGKEKNLKKAKSLRREISQIMTILKEKEIAHKERKEAEVNKKSAAQRALKDSESLQKKEGKVKAQKK